MARPDNSVTIEDARIAFRNFAGKEGQYNREGDRNFAVLLDKDIAELMLKDGWNVKYLRAREEGDEQQPYISVSVSYKGRPPRIVLITSRGRTPIGEDMVEVLDWVDIETVDLILNPYEWNVGGRGGIKAYLKTMYLTVAEDELDRKYADVPELDAGHQPRAITSGREETVVDVEVIDEDMEPYVAPKAERRRSLG